MAISVLTLGFVGLYVWIFPPFGFPLTTTGIVLAIVVFLKKKANRMKALIGLMLCLFGLTLNIILSIEMAERTGMLLNITDMVAEAVDSFLRLVVSPLDIPYLE
jgi:hypothetical protein